MIDELAQWQNDNEAFLAKALAWLRLRLQPVSYTHLTLPTIYSV